MGLWFFQVDNSLLALRASRMQPLLATDLSPDHHDFMPHNPNLWIVTNNVRKVFVFIRLRRIRIDTVGRGVGEMRWKEVGGGEVVGLERKYQYLCADHYAEWKPLIAG